MHTFLSFINYWLYVVDAHSLHAPFAYDLYSNCISADYNIEDFNAWEQRRGDLKSLSEPISVRSMGATSKVDQSAKRNVSTIAKRGLSTAKTSRLLYRLIKYFGCRHILELGTSFGINTLYMSTNREVNVASFEGCPETMRLAEETIKLSGIENTRLIHGNIDTTLREYLLQNDSVDFAFLDANHQYRATVEYFELIRQNSHDGLVIVIDDIYWSKEMTNVWNDLYQRPEVTFSIDLFQLGILIFKKDLSKQHYRLAF